MKRKRDADFDLEDILWAERRRDNPSAQLQKTAKKEKRKAIIEQRPLVYGPDPLPSGQKRRAERDLVDTNRRPSNPANMRESARKVLEALYRAHVPVAVSNSKREAAEVIRRSMGKHPVRMDQFDNKRSYDEMLDEIARARIGMSISDIELRPKRRLVV